MKEAGISGIVDDRDEKIGRKIRDAEVQKIPCMLIVGEREENNKQVSVRRHREGDKGSYTLEDFITMFQKETSTF